MTVTGKRILITGGAGFVGSSIARQLADANEVVLYDNLTNDAFTGSELSRHDNVTLVESDILDYERLETTARGANVIIHLAAIAGVDSVLKSPVRTMRVNLIGTANIVEVASRLDSLERIIDFSTSEVFGRHAYKVEETHETSGGSVGEARWTYAVSKLAGEYLAHAYYDEMGLPLSIVRPFNIYGPNQVGVGAIHHFMVRALRGDDLVIHGDGAQIRAWCFIDDIIGAVLRILETPEAEGQAFNIGNPRSVCTTYDLALRILKVTGSDSQLAYRKLGYNDVEIRIPDITKAREVLKWEPQIDLDEGLALTMQWYRERASVTA